MYFIALFGLLLTALSLVMIISPQRWSDGIISFSQKSYFHGFEVMSRFIAGCLFISFHQSTLSPLLIQFLGYLLIVVSIGLIICGSPKHQKFAIWSAVKFKPYFRACGVGALLFGNYLIYVSGILV